MTIEPQAPSILALVSLAGFLMTRAGLAKNVLEQRRKPRACPSCGRLSCSCE